MGVFFCKKFSCAEESLAINRSSPLGEIRRLCRIQLLDRSQVACGLRDHFATTVSYLWASCALSVAIVYLVFIPLYIIVMPYLWYFCFLCRQLETLERTMVYIARGKCSVYYASRVSVFFLKKVFVCRKLCRRYSNIRGDAICLIFQLHIVHWLGLNHKSHWL